MNLTCGVIALGVGGVYCMYVCIHVWSGWYLLWVALAVFADGWRRGVVVEDRTGEVVDHQHLPLQCILDQERHTIQPLALLEHIHTYTHGHIHTGRRPADQNCTQAQTCAHADMRGQRTRREMHTPSKGL